MTSVRRQGLDKERDAQGQMLRELFRRGQGRGGPFLPAKPGNCVCRRAAGRPSVLEMLADARKQPHAAADSDCRASASVCEQVPGQPRARDSQGASTSTGRQGCASAVAGDGLTSPVRVPSPAGGLTARADGSLRSLRERRINTSHTCL